MTATEIPSPATTTTADDQKHLPEYIKRPVYIVKKVVLEDDDRIYYNNSSVTGKDQKRRVKEGDRLVLVDLLTAVGSSIYTMALLEDASSSESVIAEDGYLADFYEEELQVDKSNEEGSSWTMNVDFHWLQTQRSILRS